MERVSRSGEVRQGRWGSALLLGLRALSLVAAVLVAVATLLPGRTQHQMTLLIEGRPFSDELHVALVFILFGLAGLALVGVAWRGRLARRLHMSWPLLLISFLYLLGFLALASSTFRAMVLGLVSTGLGAWLRDAIDQLDAEHAITYAAFMVIVALAWRQKLALWWLALGLFAYGYALELLQQLVPSREYRLQDLAANGLGIGIGVAAILLFDLLADIKKSPARPAHRERSRPAKRSSRSSSRSSRGAKRTGLITALAGGSIVVASILAGSMVERRFAQVGWQIFTQFSAVYAFTFWLGVLVMVIGGLMLRGFLGSSHARVRTARSR